MQKLCMQKEYSTSIKYSYIFACDLNAVHAMGTVSCSHNVRLVVRSGRESLILNHKKGLNSSIKTSQKRAVLK
jgi:hypothetical protein